MKKFARGLAGVALLIASAQVSVAAPAANRIPVADGFADWNGVVEKNHVAGRTLTPSDLRHRVVIVTEVDAAQPDKLKEQLLTCGSLHLLDDIRSEEATDWLKMKDIPRNRILVVSVRGGGGDEALAKALATTGEGRAGNITNLRLHHVAVYRNLEPVAGSPNAEGKYPYAYVVSPSGVEPVWKGELSDAKVNEIATEVGKAVKFVPEDWTSLYGVAEPKHHKAAVKLIDAGKIKQAQALLLNGIKSKDAGVAAEAQRMYDAIEQCRGDLALRVALEYNTWHGRAVYDADRLVRMFPPEKKNVPGPVQRMKGIAIVADLAKAVEKCVEWSPESGYQPKSKAEAKKNLQVLNKLKRSIAAGKTDPNTAIQGQAMRLEAELDAIIEAMKATAGVK